MADLIRSHIKKLPRRERRGWIGHFDIVTRLHCASVGVQLLFGKQQMVAHSQLSTSLTSKKPPQVFRMDYGILRRTLGLAVKEVRHRGHSVELVRLVGVELQFHGLFQHPTAMHLDSFIHGVGGEVDFAGPFDEPLFTAYLLEYLRILQCFEDPVQVRFSQFNLSAQAILKPYSQTQMSQWLHLNDIVMHKTPHS